MSTKHKKLCLDWGKMQIGLSCHQIKQSASLPSKTDVISWAPSNALVPRYLTPVAFSLPFFLDSFLIRSIQETRNKRSTGETRGLEEIKGKWAECLSEREGWGWFSWYGRSLNIQANKTPTSHSCKYCLIHQWEHGKKRVVCHCGAHEGEVRGGILFKTSSAVLSGQGHLFGPFRRRRPQQQRALSVHLTVKACEREKQGRGQRRKTKKEENNLSETGRTC